MPIKQENPYDDRTEREKVLASLLDPDKVIFIFFLLILENKQDRRVQEKTKNNLVPLEIYTYIILVASNVVKIPVGYSYDKTKYC